MCDKCRGETKDKKIVLSDSGTKTQLTINNNQQLTTNHKLIDGCVIKEGERCDHYLQIEKNNKTSHLFVELKGSNVEKAANQLETTIKSGVIKINQSEKICAAIVSTRNPLSTVETLQLKKRFLKSNRASLSFHKMQASEKIDKFT